MQEYRPIANWLVAARQSQTDDETGEPWTQDKFLAELERATGWRLHRSNLSAYENGRQTPTGKTLARFVEFWAGRGVAGPDLSPPRPPVDPLVAALTAQTLAISQLIERLDSLASQAIRDGVLDALREAGLGQDAGASPPVPPPSPQL